MIVPSRKWLLDKVAVLRTIVSTPKASCRDNKRILVACHELIVSGSLYRFERFARSIHKFGYRLAFVTFGETPQRCRETKLSVYSFEEAAATTWGVTMVPGAGFPESTIRKFAALASPRFGVRVQHVLSDQTRKPSFLAVNNAFKPDVVVFNNRQWKPGDFTEFEADAFYFLEGAVDVERLAPEPARNFEFHARDFVVGGLTTKNVEPLLGAVRLCGSDVRVHLFGPPGDLADRNRDLIDDGRLRLLGVLGDNDLASFYASIDCVVHTETFAGWANLVAEGMACGVPVVCTPHGTGAFAEHEVTALVVSDLTAAGFAAAIQRIRNAPNLAGQLARNGRQRILPFSWGAYSAALLRLMRRPDTKYDTWSPERGLFGKWTEAAQLRGLEPLLAECDQKSVLDLSAADGVIAWNCLDRRAALVHGFEREPSQVQTALRLCGDFPQAHFWEADLSDWPAFEVTQGTNLHDQYNIVLYLGIHHRLPSETRMLALMGAANRASDWLAIRMPKSLFIEDGIEKVLADRGFKLVSELANEVPTDLGASYLFRYCN